MKLIFCPICHDIVKLPREMDRSCQCGCSWGHYKDDGLNATYGGEAVPLGITNSSLVNAIKTQPKSGMGERFEAFVIPVECDTFKKGS